MKTLFMPPSVPITIGATGELRAVNWAIWYSSFRCFSNAGPAMSCGTSKAGQRPVGLKTSGLVELAGGWASNT